MRVDKSTIMYAAAYFQTLRRLRDCTFTDLCVCFVLACQFNEDAAGGATTLDLIKDVALLMGRTASIKDMMHVHRQILKELDWRLFRKLPDRDRSQDFTMFIFKTYFTTQQ
jgi:hypothetical protein